MTNLELTTILNLTGLTGPRSHFLLETFLLQLLGKHLEEQNKTLQVGARVQVGERGRPYEIDALAPDGIDEIEGPTLIEIKGTAPRTRRHFEDILARCEAVTRAGGLRSALLLVGAPVSKAVKEWFSEVTRLQSGATFAVWDDEQLNILINKHQDFVEHLAINIDGVRLEQIVARSSAMDVDSWKQIRSKHIQELRQAYTENELALFLGAGVSISVGVPSWDGLLNGLLANLIRRRESGAVTDEEIQAIVAQLRVVDSPSPLVSARYLRRGLADAFLDDVTSLLYESLARSEQTRIAEGLPSPPGRSTLQALAQLCIPRRSGPGVRAVVTYNFDDLFEEQLDMASVLHRPIFAEGEFESRDELAVYHVHGFLPRDNRKSATKGRDLESLVFSEEGYHRLFGDPYSWANLVQLALLREATCLMIGLSLTDPNLRRLLEVSARKNDKFYHYAVLCRLSVEEFVKSKDGALVQNARESAIAKFLTLHHQIQEELFGELGVRIIWIENHDEIPAIISSLPGRVP